MLKTLDYKPKQTRFISVYSNFKYKCIFALRTDNITELGIELFVLVDKLKFFKNYKNSKVIVIIITNRARYRALITNDFFSKIVKLESISLIMQFGLIRVCWDTLNSQVYEDKPVKIRQCWNYAVSNDTYTKILLSMRISQWKFASVGITAAVSNATDDIESMPNLNFTNERNTLHLFFQRDSMVLERR